MRSVLAPDPPGDLRPGERPKFSVIMAAYQASETIAAAIESVLDQTVPAHEIVVCDDGSTDDIDGALEPYLERIVLIRKQNGGEASAKNAAARRATGGFAVILDADDLFHPGRIEALTDLAEQRPDLDILTTDAVLEIDGEPVQNCYTERFTFPTERQEDEILRRNFVFGHAAVRRDLLVADGGFDESMRFATDWDRWIRLVLAGSRVGLVPEPLATYRLFGGSLSSQRARMIAGRIAALRKAERHPALSPRQLSELRDRIARYEADMVVTDAREALLDGRPDSRRRSLAVARDPRFATATRAKAALSAIAPAVAGRLLRRRGRETTAEIVLPGG